MMIQVLNNILYYLNLAALLHYHNEESSHNLSMVNKVEDNAPSVMLPEVLLKQIPPGPILPGILVKFVCAVNDSSGGGGGGGEPGTICGNTASNQNEMSYQWEMYRYEEDNNGNENCTSVIRLSEHEAEVEIKFNETVANPKTRCDLVCTIRKNTTAPAEPSSLPNKASIKLHFQSKENVEIPTAPLLPPSNFKLLDITSRAAYFAWQRPKYKMKIRNTNDNGNITAITTDSSDSLQYPEITGYIIEYKNGRSTTDWQHDNIKDGNTFAACVSSLSPWSTYHFRIISVSKNNVSAPTLPIIVRTAEDLPSAPPVDVKVQATDEKTLQVTWKPPPRTAWNGALLGYVIGLKKASAPDDEPYEFHMLHPTKTLGAVYSQGIKVVDSTVPYKIVAQAFNNIGSGPFSIPVIQTQAFNIGEK